jgi:polygalacturonase
MKRIYLYLITVLLYTSVNAADFDVSHYGAIPDGKTINTAFIQKAIDECSKAGGGRVVFPSGTWMSGTLLLKTGVTLYLDEKATLLGSPKIADYQIVDGFKDVLGQEMGYAFIGAVGAQNVGIIGMGTIDGQGKIVRESGGKNKRPFLIRFVRCTGVQVRDTRLTRSTAWTMHFFQCKKIIADRVVIRSRGLGNNDGIDIDCCEDAVIKNCDIDTGDDAICFKTTSPNPCRNVEVKNIKIFTREGAIKFGTESAGNFENISVSDIDVHFAREGGIKLFSVDGSKMRNINISNVHMYKVNMPIIVRLGSRMKTFREGDPVLPVGLIENVKISNVTVEHGTMVGIIISGIPNHNVSGLTLENITINGVGGGSVKDAAVKLEEKENAYPEISIFGRTIPSFGMYLRHAENINFKNVSFTNDTADARPAIVGYDISSITFNQCKTETNNSNEPMIKLESVKNVKLDGFQLSSKPTMLLSLEGKESTGVVVSGIKGMDAKKMIRYGTDVPASAVSVK